MLLAKALFLFPDTSGKMFCDVDALIDGNNLLVGSIDCLILPIGFFCYSLTVLAIYVFPKFLLMIYGEAGESLLGLKMDTDCYCGEESLKRFAAEIDIICQL